MPCDLYLYLILLVGDICNSFMLYCLLYLYLGTQLAHIGSVEKLKWRLLELEVRSVLIRMSSFFYVKFSLSEENQYTSTLGDVNSAGVPI